jgi:hypothetical protein
MARMTAMMNEKYEIGQKEHPRMPGDVLFEKSIVRWRGLEPPRLAAHGPQP